MFSCHRCGRGAFLPGFPGCLEESVNLQTLVDSDRSLSPVEDRPVCGLAAWLAAALSFVLFCLFFILVEQSSLAFLKAKYQVAEKTVAVETDRIKVITARLKHTL